jgi:hypothetical protein
VDSDCVFAAFHGRAPFWGLLTDINELIIHWLCRRSISPHRDPGGEHGRGLPYQGLGGFFDIHTGAPFLEPKNVVNLRCGNEEETSVHVLCECEALASLRHAHLHSFFLDPEDIRKLSIGAIWNVGKGIGLF